MFAFASLIPFLATLSVASPLGRQTSLCPSGGLPDSNRFTLRAVDKADTTVQKPLALSSSTLIGTFESISSIMAKDFDMQGGLISAYGSDGSVVGISDPVPDHGSLSFPVDGTGQVYCELVDIGHGAKYPDTLSVNGGDGDKFSLCQSTDNNEIIAIYDAIESSFTGYNFGTCTSVTIYMVPA